jgi:TusA-related sulfurtransferase
MAIDELASGQTLEVFADDPAAFEDLRRLAERLGHTVVSEEKEGDKTTIVIKKK